MDKGARTSSLACRVPRAAARRRAAARARASSPLLGVPSRRTVVLAIGVSQTIAWGSSYYLPAILAEPMARDLGLAPPWVFGAFSAALVAIGAARACRRARD